MLTIDEVGNHAALNRPGPVQGVQRAKIFDAVRLIAAQDVLHPRRFELENAAGEAGTENLLVGLLVVERQILDDDLLAAMLLDQLQRLAR